MKRSVGLIFIIAAAFACNEPAIIRTEAEQLAYDVEIIDKYLADNNIDAVKLDNGLRYRFTQEGTGPMPTKDNCVTVAYTGWVLGETKSFDSSTSNKGPLKGKIVGWQILLKVMPVGSKATFYIPSKYAYAGSPPFNSGIPRNGILVFDVELMAISPYNALGNYCN